jgi:hypothetical protein
MTILPREFEPNWFASRALRDPEGVFHSLVQYADRARVLESILNGALDIAIDRRKLLRIISVLRAWDLALAGDENCDWVLSQSQEEYAEQEKDQFTEEE